jgi:hypothetical protein
MVAVRVRTGEFSQSYKGSQAFSITVLSRLYKLPTVGKIDDKGNSGYGIDSDN